MVRTPPGRAWRAVLIAVTIGFWLAPADLTAQSLNRTTLSFGNQVVAQTSAAKTVNFKNTLATPVTLTSAAVSGGNAADFAGTPACALPAVLAPGASCTVAVRLTPAALGARSTSLVFVHNGPAGPLTALLTGTGVAPVRLSPSSLNFGNVNVGTTSSVRTVTLANVQATTLSITGISLPAGFVRQGGTCPVGPGTMGGGASCTIAVAFTPVATIGYAGSLTVTHSANNSPQVVALSGRGYPVMTTSASLSFPTRTVGTISSPKTLTVTNRMTTPLALGAVAASGDFAVGSSTCGGSLPAGGQCTVGITFTPTAVGVRSGALSVAHGAFGSPLQVPLSGAGNVNGLVSLAVTPANASVRTGDTLPMTATGTFSNGSSAALTTSVAWSILGSSPAVAGISNAAGSQGVVSGFNLGTATVTARLGAIAGSTGLTVINPTPATLTVTPSSATLGLGTTQQFTATATYSDGSTADVTDKATWLGGFPGRGRVTTSGLYTALASGSNMVSASVGSKTGSATAIGSGPAVQRHWDSEATLLLDGRVLITGGLNDTETASAELYDPTSGTFTAAAPMGAAREGHTATRLADGRVLVAGGFGSSGALSSAEIFNPASGTWAPVGTMVRRRGSHTATLIGTKVLVTGGINGTPLDTSELFDPATGAWTPTGSLGTARTAHTATLLADGRVLVAGGGTFSPVATAEIYTPAGGFWISTGAMTAARTLHTATLLANGDVLVVGGSTGSAAIASAELFHPATGTWTVTASLPVPAVYHTATPLPDGHVLIAGGTAPGDDSRRVVVYDAASGTFQARPPLAYNRYSHTAVLLNNGLVLFIGGYYWGSTAEIRDPSVEPFFLAVLPFTRTAAVGSTVAFSATASFTDGTSADVTAMATWNASPGSVATVTVPGQIKAVGPGTASVTATLGTFKASATLQVP